MDQMTLKRIAFERRLDVLEMVKSANTGHIGGSMSCMDILVCLYYQMMDTYKILNGEPDRDRFILSKGHCAEALYTVLADKGFITKDTLHTYAAFDTILAEHPTTKVRGVEAATGALGHGLSIGLGMALALRRDGNPAKVYVLMGDGELAEGSVWEAIMAASKYALDNLVAIIDRNRLQISGDTEVVMPLEPLTDKFRAFGWEYSVCNGHEPESILDALTKPHGTGKPRAIIAETIKGYGSSVMENRADWHHLVPNDEQYKQIKKDLLNQGGYCG